VLSATYPFGLLQAANGAFLFPYPSPSESWYQVGMALHGPLLLPQQPFGHDVASHTQEPVTHRRPDPQFAPSGEFGLEQTPVVVLHVPPVWHVAGAGQETELLPVHTPLWQVSVCVQALRSSHAVPAAAATQVPLWQTLQVAHAAPLFAHCPVESHVRG
jgi:hypothetical protein